jgi:hypothetical protein
LKELELLAKEGKNVERYPDYITRLSASMDLVELELRTYLND